MRMYSDRELAVLQFPPKSVRLFAILGFRCGGYREFLFPISTRTYIFPSLAVVVGAVVIAVGAVASMLVALVVVVAAVANV